MHPQEKGRENMQNKMMKKYFPVFVLPTLLAFTIGFIVPFIMGVYLSFCKFTTVTDAKFVGLQNYVKIFTEDGTFGHALWYTTAFTVVSVVLINVIGFAVALLLTKKIKGTNIFRTVFFMPNLIGGIILGYIWQFVFNKVIVYFGDALNVTVLQKSMLSGSASAFAALVLVTIWQFSGYMMLIYIAGLTGVSEDLKEAAKIDGCNESQTTRYIVLPLMRASFTICMFLTITRCFMIYDVNLSLTEGGPYGSTVMAAMYVYQKAFSAKQYGVGQTEAIILFIFTAVIAVSQTIINKRKEVEA